MKRLVLFALLSVVFWGCGGDETTTVLAHEKTGFEVAANMDGLGKCDSAHVADIAYVKDSAKVFFCNGTVWRSVDGRNGKDGTNGKDGKDGKDGKTGVDGEVGSICSVTSSGEVYTLVCGRDSVKVNTHLKTPSSCETVKNEDGTVTLKCGGKSATTIRGEDGEDAPVCKYVDNEDGTMLQVCGDVSVVLYGDFCGEEPYDPDTAFCYGVTLYPKCGGYVYDVATQACSDTGSVLEYCGDILYDPTIYNCHDDLTRSSLCGGQQYNAFYSFCYEGKVYPVCGYVGNEYDPTKYHCEADRIVGSVTDSAGNVYRTVKLGQYEWMAENYRLNVEGSLCPSEVAKDEAYSNITNLELAEDVDCSKVGRVYRWNVLMAIDEKYNTEFAGDVVKYPHRGICPEGWHVPTKEELESLIYTDAYDTGVWHDDFTTRQQVGGLDHNGDESNELGLFNYYATTYFYSATEDETDPVKVASLKSTATGSDRKVRFTDGKSDFDALRCVKDVEEVNHEEQ